MFDAEICLEVQWIDELAVAALERAGSVVTTRYYDPRALQALIDPKRLVVSILPTRHPYKRERGKGT